MTRSVWIAAFLILAVALIPSVGFAQKEHGGEHGGQTQAPAATPASTTGIQEHGGAATAPSPSAPAPTAAAPEAAPAPAAPVAPPALRPITITFTGEVASLDLTANPPRLTVQDRYGVKKEIACPAECKFSPEGKQLADLKVGDRVTAQYTYDVATGSRTAQEITIGEAAAETTP